MAVNLAAPKAADLHPVPGVRIGVAEAGIRKANRKDLSVVLIDEGASVAGVFTQNRFCAAPVQVCREHLERGGIRAMVINTGNANAGTGEDSTNYYYSFPSNRIELWFLMESSRFLDPVFREFYKERDVVREEFVLRRPWR